MAVFAILFRVPSNICFSVELIAFAVRKKGLFGKRKAMKIARYGMHLLR